MATRQRVPGDVLLHWSVPLTIVVLLVNDHWAKDRWGNAVTGKVSDLAGMFFAPILLVSLWELVRRRTVPTSTFRWFALVFGAAFVLVKTVPPVATVAEHLNGLVRGDPTVIVHDPTDAVAVVAMVPAVLLWAHRRSASEPTTPEVASIRR